MDHALLPSPLHFVWVNLPVVQAVIESGEGRARRRANDPFWLFLLNQRECPAAVRFAGEIPTGTIGRASLEVQRP